MILECDCISIKGGLKTTMYLAQHTISLEALVAPLLVVPLLVTAQDDVSLQAIGVEVGICNIPKKKNHYE